MKFLDVVIIFLGVCGVCFGTFHLTSWFIFDCWNPFIDPMSKFLIWFMVWIPTSVLGTMIFGLIYIELPEKLKKG